MKWSKGFKLTHGRHVIEHLFCKLEKGCELLENELIEFYNSIKLTKPMFFYHKDKLYDFRPLMHKVQNIQFWTLKEKNFS